MRTAGIYKISCKATGKYYIGSSINLDFRKRTHLSQLRCGTHYNQHMSRAFGKYGEAEFVFEILTICAPEMRLFFEQRFIDALEPEFNISTDARAPGGYWTGKTRSAETNAKIGAANKGRVCSEATKQLQRELSTGRGHSEATKKKMSEYWSGRVFSEEHKAKLNASRRKHQSEETRQKISTAMRGIPKSAETRQRMSEAQRAARAARAALEKKDD